MLWASCGGDEGVYVGRARARSTLHTVHEADVGKGWPTPRKGCVYTVSFFPLFLFLIF